MKTQTTETLFHIPLTDLMFAIEDQFEKYNFNLAYLYSKKIYILNDICMDFYAQGYNRLDAEMFTKFHRIYDFLYEDLMDEYVENGIIKTAEL